MCLFLPLFVVREVDVVAFMAGIQALGLVAPLFSSWCFAMEHGVLRCKQNVEGVFSLWLIPRKMMFLTCSSSPQPWTLFTVTGIHVRRVAWT